MPNPDSHLPIPMQEMEVSIRPESIPEHKITKAELIAYKEWKQIVPASLRLLVEGHLLGRRAGRDADDLPTVIEFHEGMRRLLEDPQLDTATLEVSSIVQKQLASMQRLQVGEEQLNLFAALGDQSIGFDVKANYIRSKLMPSLEFLRERDRRIMKKAIETAGETKTTGEEETEEYSPHRGPEQEGGEGLPSEAVATVAPFQGGYYMDDVYDLYDASTLTWKKSTRRLRELPAQKLDQQKTRVYRSCVKKGRGKVKLPRGWGANRQTVKWSGDVLDDWRLEQDQDGIVRVISSGGQSTTFSIEIGPSQDTISLASPESEVGEISDRFPEELMTAAQEVMGQNIPISNKARKIASLIHKHLEYDKDPAWETVYKAQPERYFEKIWEHKKAKCDEANTMLVRLLTKLGLHARFIGGHSVRTKSQAGEAMLLESNRHAWAFAWDIDVRAWVRLDATPAGDPNVDEDQQQADLGEGDYGDQEVEYMSEDELEKQLKEMEREEDERAEEEDPLLKFAKEADCTPEKAREVLEKIETLRKRYAKVLSDADRQWQTLVRENIRETIVDRGPVPLSQMDDVDPDEMVSGYIEMISGEKDPLIGEREEPERKKEKWFGGYEVYVMVDMSGSMDEVLGGVKKVDAQRDMAFLFVDSCMTAAVTAKKAELKLKAPMPVKVCVVAFGNQTQIVLPLTQDWGPKEQLKLYLALDAGAGSSTPDHLALKLIEEQIALSVRAQDDARVQKPALKKHGWKTRRVVIATADGGSDKAHLVKKATGRLEEMGIPVDLFLIGSEEDINLKNMAEAAYPCVTPLSNVDDLAEKGLKKLTERIKDAYKK